MAKYNEDIDSFLDSYDDDSNDFYKERLYIAKCHNVRPSQIVINRPFQGVIYVNGIYSGYIDLPEFIYCMENDINYLTYKEEDDFFPLFF